MEAAEVEQDKRRGRAARGFPGFRVHRRDDAGEGRGQLGARGAQFGLLQRQVRFLQRKVGLLDLQSGRRGHDLGQRRLRLRDARVGDRERSLIRAILQLLDLQARNFRAVVGVLHAGLERVERGLRRREPGMIFSKLHQAVVLVGGLLISRLRAVVLELGDIHLLRGDALRNVRGGGVGAAEVRFGDGDVALARPGEEFLAIKLRDRHRILGLMNRQLKIGIVQPREHLPLPDRVAAGHEHFGDRAGREEEKIDLLFREERAGGAHFGDDAAARDHFGAQ